jgi:DNA-directed RNA polymerase subunit L
MEINVLKEEKNEIEFELDNKTLIELLRAYLNEDSDVEFSAWRQDHYTKSPQMLVKTKGKTARKAIGDAVNAIEKELDSLLKDFEKLK